MSGKHYHVRVELNSGGLKNLPAEEIKMILRAADPLVGGGGRSMLCKILKGSKDKRLLAHDFQKDNPGYGYYRDIRMEEIQERIDFLIRRRYFLIRYDGRLPILIYSSSGWQIEKHTYAEEIFAKIGLALKNQDLKSIQIIVHDTNPEVIQEMILLIAREGNADSIALLESISGMVSKANRKLLNAAISAIKDRVI